MDGGVELGYMTDQGRDRDTEAGGGGGRAQSVVVSSAGMYRETDEMISGFFYFLSRCHDY